MTTTAIVYTKKGCWGCEEAKDLLSETGVAYTEVQLSDVEALKKHVGGAPVFPKVVYSGRVLSVDQLRDVLQEPLLIENPNRFTVFPIKYEDMWRMYKKAVASFWTVEEIDMSKDKDHWDSLKPEEQHFLKHVLAFFASSDGIVNENLAKNFMHEVQAPEARQFYAYQAFNETIHSETYAMLIDSYVKDFGERNQVFDAIHTMPSVRKKAQWAQKWMSQERRFAERLVAFVCVEGILFSGSFCAIFWMKKRGLLPGLSFSNEMIARDEGLHMEFGILMYRHLRSRLDRGEVVAIVTEAVENEKEFVKTALPCNLIGMNAKLMSAYIEFVGDRILRELDYEPHYNAKNPFDFMENISLSGKTNFFERRVGEYAKVGVATQDTTTFELNEDF
jgi:ribonucleotide reductase beta subunit family protein with ferritin-like domain